MDFINNINTCQAYKICTLPHRLPSVPQRHPRDTLPSLTASTCARAPARRAWLLLFTLSFLVVFPQSTARPQGSFSAMSFHKLCWECEPTIVAPLPKCPALTFYPTATVITSFIPCISFLKSSPFMFSFQKVYQYRRCFLTCLWPLEVSTTQLWPWPRSPPDTSQRI